MEALVNGVKLFYQQSGASNRPALLLIHGFPFDSEMWRAQLDALGKRWRVIAPDLRGHGRSEVGPGSSPIEQHADDLAALLDQLAVHKAAVAGLSMGGYVALAFWERHAQKVAGLALVDTRANGDTQEGRAGRNATIGRLQAQGVGVLVEDMMPKLLSPENAGDERVVNVVREIILRQPAEGMVQSLGAMRDREDRLALLPTITVPAIVVAGEHDAITPPEVAVTMAKAIPHARAVIIAGAGHMAPLENPEPVNTALHELLAISHF